MPGPLEKSISRASSASSKRRGRPFSTALCLIEETNGNARRKLLEWLGVGWAKRIVPYRGFGTPLKVRVLARVLEDRGALSPSLERGLWGGVRASWRRYRTAELSRQSVRLQWGAVDRTFCTDEEGFLDEEVSPPADCEPGVHHAKLTVEGPGDSVSSVQLPIHVYSPSGFGVISDIDDTLIDANISNRWSRARAMFLSEAAPRRPFLDAAALCGQLVGDGTGTPMVYVSSSPWNLFDHLTHFFDTHGFPPGPILLRDWGFRREGFAPDGRHGHKLEKIRKTLELFAKMPFVLLGDSSQEDAQHYLEISESMPGRVLAVLIRRVPTRPGRLERLEVLEGIFAERQVPFAIFDGSESIDEVLTRVGVSGPKGR